MVWLETRVNPTVTFHFSHGHVDKVFFFGREYYLMPRILLHAISRAMAEICPSFKGSASKAQEALKKNLNETRKTSKGEDQVNPGYHLTLTELKKTGLKMVFTLTLVFYQSFLYFSAESISGPAV